jgi:hypothetical protein
VADYYITNIELLQNVAVDFPDVYSQFLVHKKNQIYDEEINQD